MMPSAPPSELLAIAPRVVWFEAPEKALSDPARFFAYAMRYASHQDMEVFRRFFSDDDLRGFLASAPPGIVDPRSWSYWHLKLDQYPPPPLSVRTFGENLPKAQ